MSNEGFVFQASVKDADGDMVNVRADSHEELEANLLNFPVAAYAQFKANVRGGAALGGITQPQQAPVQQAAPQQQSQGGGNGWGAAQSQPQQQQQQSAPQGGGRSQHGAQLHPEGKQCEVCGETLQYGMTRTNKGQWKCSQYRWNNGNPNNHTLEWA